MNTAAKNNFRWIHVIIAFVLTFGFGLLPAPEPITHMGMQIMGVFFGMLWGWCFTDDMIWPSLLGIVALGMTEYTTVSGSLTLFFGNTTTQQMICCMIFFGYMDKCGLSTSMAKWIMTRKFINGKPWVLAITLFVAEAVLASLVSLIVTIIIIWQIFTSACEEMGYKKHEAFPAYVLMGTLICGSYGSGLLPFKGGGLILSGLVQAGTGQVFPMAAYICTADVIIVGFILGYVLLGKFVIRPDVTKFMSSCEYLIKLQNENKKVFREEQKPQIIALIIFSIVLFAVGLWPKTAPMYEFISNIGIQGAAIILVMAMIIVHDKDNKPELVFAEAFHKGVYWDMVLLLGASFPVADAIKAEESGLLAFVAKTLTPLLHGVGFIPFLIIIALAMLLLSQFAHNLILQMIFIPLTCPIMISAGFDPVVSSVVIFYSCNLAFFTPGASMIGAMLYGNEWIPNKNIFTWLIPYSAICIAFLIIWMMFASTVIL